MLQNTKSCHWQLDWLHLRTLAKHKSVKEGKIHETLEIKLKVKTEFNESSKVLNRDQRNIVNTNSWKLVV